MVFWPKYDNTELETPSPRVKLKEVKCLKRKEDSAKKEGNILCYQTLAKLKNLYKSNTTGATCGT